MISVQNRQPLLSGNRTFGIFFILIIFLLSSCGAFRKVDYYEDDKDTTVEGPKVDKPNEVDTIKWDSKPSDYPPPIADAPKPPLPPKDPNNTNSDTNNNSNNNDNELPEEEHKNSYNIAVIAPFYTNKSSAGAITNKNSLKSLEFYNGAKMAFDQLAAQGMNLNVFAYDSEGSTSTTSVIMSKSEIKDMDLIIGPMKSSTISTVAQKVKGTETKLVSPWNPKTGLSPDNPNYIQVSPTLETHARAIIKDARNKYSTSKMVLACRKETNENAYFSYYQKANKELAGGTTSAIRQMEAEYGNDIPLGDFFNADTTIFIVASWDEAFVSNLLRKIYSEKGNRFVAVYGLPMWYDFERISYDYYENLNVHISHNNYVDNDDVDVQNFKRDYFNRTGIAPTDDAYLGYETALYFGRMLKERGSNFQAFLQEDFGDDYMHTKFHFVPSFKTGEENFSLKNATKFENQFLNILHFKDYYFQKVN